MNLTEMVKLLRLSSLEIKRVQSYIEKAENAQVIYCPDCTGEFYDFEGECQLCKNREKEDLE